jgi:hypothetical protein
MGVSNLADIIMNELIPFDYYYDIPTIPNIPVTHESTERYLRFVINSYISKNNENFINVLKSKNDIDFIKELNIHFAFYNKQTNDMTLWLSHTERLIKKNINDRYLRYAFDNWLKEIQPLSQPQPQNSLPIIEENKDSKEPINLYPKIFKNGYAWEMFLELKRLSVDKNPLADYSFIYFKMFDKRLGAINETVTHPIFIKFLNDNCDTDISAKKLTFKDQLNKHKLYSTTLNKFQADILGNP